MARELRIEARLRLPEGDFDEAAAIMAAKPAYDSFLAAVTALGGEAECAVVSPKPRGASKNEGDPT